MAHSVGSESGKIGLLLEVDPPIQLSVKGKAKLAGPTPALRFGNPLATLRGSWPCAGAAMVCAPPAASKALALTRMSRPCLCSARFGAFKSANLDGSSFKGANMARVMMEFASLRGTDLTNANLRKSELSAADLTDADVTGANFDGADLNATKIGKMKNAAAAKNLDKAKNLGQAVTN